MPALGLPAVWVKPPPSTWAVPGMWETDTTSIRVAPPGRAALVSLPC